MKVTALLSLSIAIVTTGSLKAAGGETQYFKRSVEGVVDIRITVEKRVFTVGERILVTKLLINRGSTDLDIVVDALEEGFSIEALGESCGVILDHVPGYEARRMSLPFRAATSAVADLSRDDCFKGPGRYKLRGGYCHHVPGRRHGQDPPDWCVAADPIVVAVRKQ